MPIFLVLLLHVICTIIIITILIIITLPYNIFVVCVWACVIVVTDNLRNSAMDFDKIQHDVVIVA